MNANGLLALAASCLLLTACERPLTAAEARSALEEASIESQTNALIASNIELTTSFTIGGAAREAAQELRAFIAAQLPCALVAVDEATLTIEYGANGTCSFHGSTYTGAHTVTIVRNAIGDVLVHHQWNDLSNGKVSVTGEADVTWSAAQGSRRVVHELTWLRESDGRTGEGRGDRTQTLLPGGLAEGIELNGERDWTGEAGTWSLDIDGVQMRWSDPVPQAGSYTLGTPYGKTASLSFQREDADTIRVTVASGRRSFAFDVTRSGQAIQR